MPWSISLLTVLFNMCYFVTKGRNEAVYTTITRAVSRDYFTNVCRNCHEYGAKQEDLVCRCEESITRSSGSLFLRSEKHCRHEDKFMVKEGCQRWSQEFIELIDTERTDLRYVFSKGIKYVSCQLEPFISYLNGTTGEWQLFNSSANLFAMESLNAFSLQIKVTRLSSSLRQFKGYVMKFGLKCTTRLGESEKSCLLFKAKGQIVHFPLNCSPTPPSSSIISTTATTIAPTTIITPSSVIVPPSITSTIISPEPPVNGGNEAIIAVIAAIGTVLCLSLICVFAMLLYRYTNICKPRGHQTRNLDHDFNVISNPGPQTYRIQEEPLYEVILPSEKATEGASERSSVILNPYVNQAVFTTGRRTREPLPPRPENEGNPNTRIDTASPAYQNESNDIHEETDGSIVLKNPRVEETSFSPLQRSENDLTRTSEVHDHHHNHHHHHHCGTDEINQDTIREESEGTEQDLVYQGLTQKTRAQSVFVCPTCNKDSVYQRLCAPRSCPHAGNEIPKEKRASFYASLKELEKGSRESFYANPSCITTEPFSEVEENRKSGEGLPDYQILEPEETISNEEPDDPVSHDYNVLEGPEETCREVDDHTKDSATDIDQTTENQYLPIEPSEDTFPVYAKPYKPKKKPELPNELPEGHNIEDNQAYAKPCKTEEDSDLLNELPESRSIEDIPAYEKSCKKNGGADLPIELPENLNLDENPAYAKPYKPKKNIDLSNELPEGNNVEDSAANAKPCNTEEDSDLPDGLPEDVNLEENPAYARPLEIEEDSDFPNELPEVLNMDDNPAYAKPWNVKQDTGSPIEPSEFLNIENNPAYAMPWKAEAMETYIRRKSV